MITLDTALDYLLSVVTENEEVKKFPKDFVTASMQWIRSWFLIDDPVSSSIVDNATMPEVAKKAVLEAKLNALKDNPEFMKELEAKMAEFSTHRERVKNIVNERIDVKGNVRIGDKSVGSNDNYDKKNIVNAPITTEGDFHLGDG
jgi:hypothetical protein